ncbi:MAG: threonine/serine dehydratase [Candidatus Hodarchaeota archaeon]
MNFTPAVIAQRVKEAENRIRNYIRETPIEFSHYLSEIGGCNVYLKLENQQITGSFKIRGALNKLLSIPKNKAVTTASSGNHGLAVAYALSITGGLGTIYLPKTTTQTKIDALRKQKTKIIFYGADCQKTEIFARKVAKEEGKEFISPYNDIEIISGQGTIGVELVRQIDHIDSLLVSVGGGGLISGIAGLLKDYNPGIEIIGCLPENSPVMYESVKSGKIIEMESKPTLSDGTAGGIEPNAITFDLCQRFIDKFIIVNEEEIKDGIRFILAKHHMIIEGAAGVTVASFLKEKNNFKGKNVVIIICGANIGLDQLKSILCLKS